MNRKEALKQMAVLSGGALSFSTIAGVMGGCRAQQGANGFQPTTLTDHQNKMVINISEHIIPETDTPGAKVAGVNEFVDKLLTDWYYEDEKKHFLSELDYINQKSQQLKKKAYLDLSDDDQIAALEELEAEGLNASGYDSNKKPIFLMLKELTIVGYYTSEVGATEELRTSVMPGTYEEISYTPGDAEWSNAAT